MNIRYWYTAVGLRDDKIVFVGFDDDVGELNGPDTHVIDLDGKILMPSFQDVHVHPTYAGKEALTVNLNGKEFVVKLPVEDANSLI